MNLIPTSWTPKAVTAMIMQLGSFAIVAYLLVVQHADTNSILAVAGVLTQLIAGAIAGSSATAEATKNLQSQLSGLQVMLEDFQAVSLSDAQRVALSTRRQMRLENQSPHRPSVDAGY